MRLHLLHGPAINSSRIKLISLKEKFDNNNVVVYENGTAVQEILGGIMTLPLLSEERLIILENPPEDFTFDSALVTSHLSLVIWFDHEVSDKKPIMEWVKKSGQILYFPEAKEVSIFPFLDLLAAGDKKAFLEMDKLKKAGFDIHYLIAMVFYLLRNLVATPKTAPDFVKKKLTKQRARFTGKNLESLYRDILEIDFKIKSGLLEKDQAEFLLVNKFL